jgi:hypothetical protein
VSSTARSRTYAAGISGKADIYGVKPDSRMR